MPAWPHAAPSAAWIRSARATASSGGCLAWTHSCPGVSRAALTTAVPFASAADRLVELGGSSGGVPGQMPSVTTIGVSASYFETLGTALRQGRMFGDRDGPNTVSPS